MNSERVASVTRWRPTTRGWALVGALVLGAMTVGCPGCHSGPRNYLNDNDRLRRENLELKAQLAKLQGQMQLQASQLTTLQQQLEGHRPAGLAGVPGAGLPGAGAGVTAITLDRLSGAVDTNEDGEPDLVRLYVKPIDSQGRFIVTAGRAVVQVVAIEPGQEPKVIVERSFSPEEFDAAYRSSFMGTHYTLEVELPNPMPPLPPNLDQVTVKLTFTDAATGVTVSAQRAVKLGGNKN